MQDYNICLFGKDRYATAQFVEWYLDMVNVVSKKSKDPSTKVGAVIVSSINSVLSVGYNGFARCSYDLKENYDNRYLKYKLVVHAEANAIYNAARSGTSLYNSICFTNIPCCVNCTNALIQSGVKIFISGTPNENIAERWKEDFELASNICNETKTQRLVYDYKYKRLEHSTW